MTINEINSTKNAIALSSKIMRRNNKTNNVIFAKAHAKYWELQNELQIQLVQFRQQQVQEYTKNLLDKLV